MNYTGHGSSPFSSQLPNDDVIASLPVKYQSNSFCHQNFPSSIVTPPFLETHLLSPDRRIRSISQPYRMVKCFLFQLLRLCFDLQDGDYYLQTVKDILFDATLSDVNPTQSRKGIAQYIERVNREHQSWETVLERHPQVFTLWIQSLNDFAQKSMEEYAEEQHILECLCEIFEISLISCDGCYHLEQSDVYLYPQPQAIYLVYKDKEGNGQSSHTPNLKLQGEPEMVKSGYGSRETSLLPSDRDTLINEINDIKSSQTSQSSRYNFLHQRKPSWVGASHLATRESLDHEKFKSKESLDMYPFNAIQQHAHRQPIHNLSPPEHRQKAQQPTSTPLTQKYQLSDQVRPSGKVQPLFYNPINDLKKHKHLYCPFSSKEPAIDNKEDSKGALYRMFSNTKILNILSQPQRTRIDIMRSRMKGYQYPRLP